MSRFAPRKHRLQLGATRRTGGTPGPPSRSRRRLFTRPMLLVSVVLAAATGCQGIPRRLVLRPDVAIPPSVVHVFFVDGLQRAALREMLAAGELRVSVLKSADRWFGMTYHEDRARVAQALSKLHETGAYPEELR